MKKSSLIIWIVAFCALFLAAYTFYAKYKPEAGTPGKPASEQTSGQTAGTDAVKKVPIPDFKLKDLSGKDVSLSDYKGKLVVLNFWAVWCSVCKAELPEMNELNKELEKGKDAVLLAVDVQEDEKTVKDYLDPKGYSLNVLMDKNGQLAQTFGIEGYPTTFLIDREGNAVAYIPGGTTKATLEELINKFK